jgi:hypothetical protein
VKPKKVVHFSKRNLKAIKKAKEVAKATGKPVNYFKLATKEARKVHASLEKAKANHESDRADLHMALELSKGETSVVKDARRVDKIDIAKDKKLKLKK